MIVQRYEGEWSYPAVLCNTCRREITDATYGLVLWPMTQPRQLIYVHKGRCDPNGEDQCSEELDAFLDNLVCNATRDSVR